jgi:hypothetical protein
MLEYQSPLKCIDEGRSYSAKGHIAAGRGNSVCTATCLTVTLHTSIGATHTVLLQRPCNLKLSFIFRMASPGSFCGNVDNAIGTRSKTETRINQFCSTQCSGPTAMPSGPRGLKQGVFSTYRVVSFSGSCSISSPGEPRRRRLRQLSCELLLSVPAPTSQLLVRFSQAGSVASDPEDRELVSNENRVLVSMKEAPAGDNAGASRYATRLSPRSKTSCFTR